MIRKRHILATLLVLVILVPACVGFSIKFKELLILTGDPDGAFAIMPVVSYLTVSIGFFFLLIYATWHGMFHNIERPKYAFFERERFLDEGDDSAVYANE